MNTIKNELNPLSLDFLITPYKNNIPNNHATIEIDRWITIVCPNDANANLSMMACT
ncbi:MAG: hypothetical protein V4651_10505 [Bacteroidota bacterium]